MNSQIEECSFLRCDAKSVGLRDNQPTCDYHCHVLDNVVFTYPEMNAREFAQFVLDNYGIDLFDIVKRYEK